MAVVAAADDVIVTLIIIISIIVTIIITIIIIIVVIRYDGMELILARPPGWKRVVQSAKQTHEALRQAIAKVSNKRTRRR